MTLPTWLSIAVVVLSFANLGFLLTTKREIARKQFSVATSAVGLLAGAMGVALDSGGIPRTGMTQALSSALVLLFFGSFVFSLSRPKEKSSGA